MAYMRPLDEQNQQQTQQGQQSFTPSSFGGGQTISAEPGAVASSGQQSKAQGQSGTSSGNWINISDYLNANPSMGKKAVDQSSGLLSKEGDIYNKAAQPLKDATANFKYDNMTPQEIENAIKSGDIERVRGVLSQKGYTGPNKIDYDLYGSGNIYDAAKLSNKGTAATVLAGDYVKKGGYGNGLRTLDTSLLGADPEYAAASPKLWSNVNDFVTKTGLNKRDLEKIASDDIAKVDTAKKGTLSTVGGLKDKYKQLVDSKVKDYSDKALAAKQDYYKKYSDWYQNTYAPAKHEQLAADYKGKPEPGYDQSKLFGYTSLNLPQEGPSSSNVGSDEEYRALGSIGKILGESPVYSRSGQYALPYFKQDNGQSFIDAFKNSPQYQRLPQFGPVKGGAQLPVDYGPNWISNEILSQGGPQYGETFETPEQLAQRLGLV